MALKTKVNQQDLKIYPSERLTQTDDGGGMPLGKPLTGALNELFKPISSIARINGAFYAVLEYLGVLRADDEPLIGAFAAITKLPSDPTVSYLMFKATRFGESRAEILKRIEAYNTKTIESRMTLLSTQSKGSKVVQAYQTVGEPLPNVGDRYCLDQNKAGYPIKEQFIQVARVSAEDREFTTKNGNKFRKTVVKLEITTKLEADFIGVDYPEEGYVANPCKIRETGVADAAQYYGVKPLAQAIKQGEMQIKIESLMEKIAPVNQVSTPLLDLTAAGQRQTLFDGSRAGDDGIITLVVNKSHNAGQISSLYFGNAITPGSVVINTNVGKLTDKGGTLYQGAQAVGTLDYARGTALINEPSFSGYVQTINFRASMAELKVADTQKIDVTINNRSDSYMFNIFPPPAVGTLQASYRAQGKWYDLYDDGSGALSGATAAHGSGTVSYITGSGVVTLGELPDVGSAILLSWGTRANYFNRSGIATTAKMLLQLNNDADPSTLMLTWNSGSGAMSAQSDAAGNITGDWTGKYDLVTRQIRIDTGPNFRHPNGALDITVAYSQGQKIHKEFSAPNESGNSISLKLNDSPIKPNSLRLEWSVGNGGKYTITARDDGNGGLLNNNGSRIGTVDYQNATATFKADVDYTYTYTEPQYTYIGVGRATRVFTGYTYEQKPATWDLAGAVKAWFFDMSANSHVIETLSSGAIEIDVLPHNAEVIAPSSLNVKWGGKTYFDKLGTLYCDLNPVTGEATQAGTVSYQNGVMTINNWRWTDGSAPVINSLVTSISGNPVDHAVFRTPKAPLTAGGLSIRAAALDGTSIAARANLKGEIKAADIEGTVDFEYGVVDVCFGAWVAVTDDVKKQAWYSDEGVVNGKIWQPKPVFAESITYNADATAYLPVDSAVVKINTVRLPQDGRVPIFRRGDTILITNRQTDDLGSAFTGGQTIQLSRNDVDRICLNDADNKAVNAELWDYDLDAGTITFVPSLDLSSYKMPLSATHTQEQRNRIVDLDIDGTLSLLFALNRDYEVGNTFVSSVLIGGDLQVRVSVPFTQKSWNNVWQDTPVSEQLLNKLKLTDYPMILTDDGAITDRWLIKFTSSSQFELYSEALGFVGKFDTLTNLAPINPATGKPYFTIDKRAFGTDTPWAVQDVIRFNTWGTLMPVWVLCAVQPNPNPPTGEDGFEQYLFGDTTEIKEG